MLEGKPDREPDYISDRGVYFWFDELVYLNHYLNTIVKLEVCNKSSKLRVKGTNSKTFACEECDACVERRFDDCIRYYLNEPIQKAYSDWAINAFEKNVLGGCEYE